MKEYELENGETFSAGQSVYCCLPGLFKVVSFEKTETRLTDCNRTSPVVLAHLERIIDESGYFNGGEFTCDSEYLRHYSFGGK